MGWESFGVVGFDLGPLLDLLNSENLKIAIAPLCHEL